MRARRCFPPLFLRSLENAKNCREKNHERYNTKVWQLQDCKKPVSGKSFYAMEGQPVCPKCVGVDDDEEEEEQEA